jgi:hypothetical protein
MSRYSDAIKILGPKAHETIRTTPVLVVGAGGIGSELRASSRSLVASTGVVRREVRIRALTVLYFGLCPGSQEHGAGRL